MARPRRDQSGPMSKHSLTLTPSTRELLLQLCDRLELTQGEAVRRGLELLLATVGR